MTAWIAIGVTAVGCYAVKLLGLSLPAARLEHPLVRRLAALVPLALLAALTAVQTFDAEWPVAATRGAGLAAAAAALVLRAPFLVVIGAAVATTAGLRLLTG